jgi:hypothetical protein
VGVVLEALEDHRDDELIWDEVPVGHVARRFAPQLGGALAVRAQEISGSDVRELELFAQQGGLRALPGARRPEQDEVQWIGPRRGVSIGR